MINISDTQTSTSAGYIAPHSVNNHSALQRVHFRGNVPSWKINEVSEAVKIRSRVRRARSDEEIQEQIEGESYSGEELDTGDLIY